MDSMLDLSFDDVYEPQTHPDGTEVSTIIERADLEQSKKGRPQVHVVIRDAENQKIEDIHQYISLPQLGDDPKAANAMLNRLRVFYQCYGVDYTSGVDVKTELPGQTGDIVVNEETDPIYGTRNSVRTFIVPR